jgi:lipoprotein-releasing system ATP-binding protein
MNDDMLYRLTGVSKHYAGPSEQVTVLDQVDLDIPAGQALAVIGASGSGKSTLLQILGTLDLPSSGKVLFQNVDLTGLDWKRRARIRNRKIGFVFQFHHLLPEFNAQENVAMPGIIAGLPRSECMDKAGSALELVEMAHRRGHKASTLSGGERQRVAIARSLLMSPRVILADEPTGNLDQKSGRHITELLLHLNRTLQTTLVVVTHNRELAQHMDRQLELRSGELYDA